MAKTDTIDPLNLPHLADRCPDYAAWSAKVMELRKVLRALEDEQSDILHDLANRTVSDSAVISGQRVAELLGEAIEEAGLSSEESRKRLTALDGEMRNVRSAIEIAEQRQARARIEASRQILEEAKPAFTKRVAGFCSALVAAHDAAIHVEDLLSALGDRDVPWNGPFVQVRGLFLGLKDPYGRVGRLLREAAEAGYIMPEDIPDELR